jgi:hypothetical protein
MHLDPSIDIKKKFDVAEENARQDSKLDTSGRSIKPTSEILDSHAIMPYREDDRWGALP